MERKEVWEIMRASCYGNARASGKNLTKCGETTCWSHDCRTEGVVGVKQDLIELLLEFQRPGKAGENTGI